MTFPFISGFSSIVLIAPATNFHSHTHAPRPASQIARPAPIEAMRGRDSFPSIWNAIINQYITADSTSAIHKIVTVRKKFVISFFFPITSIALFARIHCPIATQSHERPTANPGPI
jgi:hypothetical protein